MPPSPPVSIGLSTVTMGLAARPAVRAVSVIPAGRDAEADIAAAAEVRRLLAG